MSEQETKSKDSDYVTKAVTGAIDYLLVRDPRTYSIGVMLGLGVVSYLGALLGGEFDIIEPNMVQSVFIGVALSFAMMFVYRAFHATVTSSQAPKWFRQEAALLEEAFQRKAISAEEREQRYLELLTRAQAAA